MIRHPEKCIGGNQKTDKNLINNQKTDKMIKCETWEVNPRPIMYAYKSIEDYNNHKNPIFLLNGGMGTLKTAAKGAIAALKNTLGNNATPVVVVKGDNETYVLK